MQAISQSQRRPSEPDVTLRVRPATPAPIEAKTPPAVDVQPGLSLDASGQGEPARRISRCERVRENFSAAALLAAQACLRAGVAQASGLLVGGLLRSASSTGASDGGVAVLGGVDLSRDMNLAAFGGIVGAVGVATGFRAGTLASHRMAGGRCMLLFNAAGMLISGGLPFAAAYAAASRTAASPQDFKLNFAISEDTSAGRMLSQITRDTINSFAFSGVIGSLEVSDWSGQTLSAGDLALGYDVYRTFAAQGIYTISSAAHLLQLRDVLAEEFQIDAGFTFEKLMTGSFGAINSSVINEVFDDFQSALMQACVALALGYSLRHKRGPGCEGIKANLQNTSTTLKNVWDNAAMRIAGFAPAECAAILAMTYPKHSTERIALLLFSAVMMGATEWRGDFVRHGQRLEKLAAQAHASPQQPGAQAAPQELPQPVSEPDLALRQPQSVQEQAREALANVLKALDALPPAADEHFKQLLVHQARELGEAAGLDPADVSVTVHPTSSAAAR